MRRMETLKPYGDIPEVAIFPLSIVAIVYIHKHEYTLIYALRWSRCLYMSPAGHAFVDKGNGAGGVYPALP
jgi:hypothetical protein